MSEAEIRQTILDQEHLKVLSIAYLAMACVSALYSLFGLVYALFGMLVAKIAAIPPNSPDKGPPPEFVGWFFCLFGLAWFLIMMTSGVLKFLVYQRLKQRRSRGFCQVVAGLGCLGIPYGTVLGVFTFIVLARPSVARLFQESSSSMAGTGG
ncbi:MAG: hypothetical protein L0312_27255 [Acidobacteria bacterium]|nr:hypothetical protein [Acidobacteriota bacterium]